MQTEEALLCRRQCRLRCQQQAKKTAALRPIVITARIICVCAVIVATIPAVFAMKNAPAEESLPAFTAVAAYAIETPSVLTTRPMNSADIAEADTANALALVDTAAEDAETAENAKAAESSTEDDAKTNVPTAENTSEQAAPTPAEKNAVKAESAAPAKRDNTSTNPTPLADDVYQTLCASTDETITVPLMLGLIELESNFNENAVSSVGCYGLCQLNPRYYSSGLSPSENVAASIKHLRRLYENCGDIKATLTAYNAGHDTGDRSYANTVLAKAEKWENILEGS